MKAYDTLKIESSSRNTPPPPLLIGSPDIPDRSGFLVDFGIDKNDPGHWLDSMGELPNL
jgi:hypothetical protein